MNDFERELSDEAGMGSAATGAPEPADTGVARPAAGSASGGARKSPEQIRQEIEGTKERIFESVEALAENKAEVDYVKAHPTQVLKERATDLKEDIVSKVSQMKQELSGKAAEALPGAGAGAGAPGGAAEVADKVVKSVRQGVESLEAKLDEKLGVSTDDPADQKTSRSG